MLDKAKRASTFLIIRGLLSLVFGVLVLALPEGEVAKSLIWVFGVFALVEGTFACIGALLSTDTFEDWILLFLAGVLGIVIGIFALTQPVVAAVAIVMYIAIRAIISGVLEIAVAIRLRKQVEGEWLMILGGAISVLFGLVLLRYPIADSVAVVVWLIGIYAIAVGAMELVLAGQVHHWLRRIEEHKKTVAGKTA
jgi:uncharacterized membrane protein HdeD (DUF308 family)